MDQKANDRQSQMVSVQWLSNLHTVGVVLISNEHAGFKAYIGPAVGLHDLGDMLAIYRYGAKLSYQEAYGFFGRYMKAINADKIHYDGKEYGPLY